ncbi:hypothetical protein K435DRAFT_851227 [Dendrothele bispora CBS 962.96]|uniref:Uncharacterized protein n=1 Tax=Dendrothele bispora (strain CBS 962.96) TaxID=1314807 RepID=A0A4S8MMG0_DENBC|nr:hypothetical protein K435DRAFT_851227 [Dendrothele bispora CBS 962.96]
MYSQLFADAVSATAAVPPSMPTPASPTGTIEQPPSNSSSSQIQDNTSSPTHVSLNPTSPAGSSRLRAVRGLQLHAHVNKATPSKLDRGWF